MEMFKELAQSFGIVALNTFVLTALFGPFLIKRLQKLKFGQKILEIGPKWHLTKQYTPTMGGFMFIIPMIIVICAMTWRNEFQLEYLSPLLFALAFGVIGFIDDYTKVKKKQNLGLTAIQKLILQLAMAAVFILILRSVGIVENSLYVPFFGVSFDIPWAIYIPFAMFVIVGTVNAVNLTDGIDGLVSSVTLPVAIFFFAIALYLGDTSVAITSAAVVGGLLGFLIYNFNPAKVFMGDTGSLFLGGIVSAFAFQLNIPLILIPIGIIYIMEALSDIIQVTYFKMSGGKRVFKMAPIHHHFEMCGWGEKKIVFVFSGITVVMCILAYVFF